MKTRILKTDRQHRAKSIAAAARLIQQGDLVAFPTETVYGLGANAFDKKAVAKIFKAKGRPSDNPLIAHIWTTDQVWMLAERVPVMFWLLAEHFMPGPLTLVVQRSDRVPDIVSAGLRTVALRIPDHPVARALLKAARTPIVAPSANLSGRPSPTNVFHVLDDLNGRIAGVLDGGQCRIGLESTVVDLTKRTPVILRPGGVTREQLEDVLRIHVRAARSTPRRPAAPGMKYKHYAPHAEVVIVEGSPENVARHMAKSALELKGKGIRAGIMVEDGLTELFSGVQVFSLGERGSQSAAQRLFEGFRSLDAKRVDVILCQGFDEHQLGSALMNRMRKAATRRIRV